MQTLLARVRTLLTTTKTRLLDWYRRFRALPPKKQWLYGVGVFLLLIILISLLRGGEAAQETPRDRLVSVATVGTLSGTGDGSSVFGTVRSVTEARLFAQNGGVVERVNTELGASVPAGFVIAELENDSEAAAVLQAEGSYDAAVAARSAQSVGDSQTTARNTYRSAYATLDGAVQGDIDTFFGGPTPYGPDLLIFPNRDTAQRLSEARRAIDATIDRFAANQATAGSRSPSVLLDEAESVARQIQTFLVALAEAANERDSQATPAQLTALSSARTDVNTTLASIAGARTALRSGSVSATAGADAQVKQALGSLRAAQASYERTRIRATIGGTVNFLPLQAGQYVASFTHVATVAQNGALEIVTYVSEEDRDRITIGDTLTIEDGIDGTVTAIAPALDPLTRQIEVRIAATAGSALVNGQSVRVTLPGAPASLGTEGPVLLPLSAVKLQGSDRVVFTLDGDSRLTPYAVEIGEVTGDRIVVTSPIPRDLRIVADARGLSAGQRVRTVEAQ
jgi:RND family efflux transporter MFP subunit